MPKLKEGDMPKFEKNILRAIQQNILLLAFVVSFFLSIIIRIIFVTFCTSDMAVFLLPWVEELKIGGFAALKNGVGNYNIPYQLLLLLAAKLPIPPIITIKAFSIVFDYLLAAGVGLIVYTLRKGTPEPKRRRWGWLAFIVTSLLPLVILNGSLWGQCDSVYGAFAVWSVLFLLQKKHGCAFVMLAIGFCFKLQIIFLLPLFVILYFVNKKFSVAWFLSLPIILFISTLPSVLQGGSPLIGLEIYTGQTGTYSNPYINYPNLAALFQDKRWQFFSVPLVLITLLVFLAMMSWLLYQKAEVKGESLLLLGLWSVLTCVCLLPSMHERYAFVGEVLLWAWFLAKPAKNRLLPALLFGFSGYCAYASFLFGFWPVKPELVALINLATLGWLAWQFMVSVPKKQQGKVAKPSFAAGQRVPSDVFTLHRPAEDEPSVMLRAFTVPQQVQRQNTVGTALSEESPEGTDLLQPENEVEAGNTPEVGNTPVAENIPVVGSIPKAGNAL